MISLLLLITGMNFFIYSPASNNKHTAAVAATDSGEEKSNLPSPSGPDEKSPNSTISVNEEYLHHEDEVINAYVINQCKYAPAAAGKLPVVHFEILSPPPNHS